MPRGKSRKHCETLFFFSFSGYFGKRQPTIPTIIIFFVNRRLASIANLSGSFFYSLPLRLRAAFFATIRSKRLLATFGANPYPYCTHHRFPFQKYFATVSIKNFALQIFPLPSTNLFAMYNRQSTKMDFHN